MLGRSQPREGLPREEVEEPRASGGLIQKERVALEKIVGAEVVVEALATLPDDRRREYDELGALTQIRASTVEMVYQAVADHTGRDVFRMHREIVRVSVESALRTVWRVLLRFTTDQALVRRTPLFFSKGLSRGKLNARIVRPGQAEIRLTDWPEVPPLQINGIAAAIEAVLSCAGRENVRVEGHPTLDGACMVATWHVG